jgi:hypothetical protein
LTLTWKAHVNGSGEFAGKAADISVANGLAACQHVFDQSAEPIKSEGLVRIMGAQRETIELPLRVCIECDWLLELYPS